MTTCLGFKRLLGFNIPFSVSESQGRVLAHHVCKIILIADTFTRVIREMWYKLCQTPVMAFVTSPFHLFVWVCVVSQSSGVTVL